MHPILRALLSMSLWLLLSAAAPSPTAAAVEPAVEAASTAIGACFARENPECAEPWISKLEARLPGSQAVAYTRGFQALLSGDFERSAKILAGVQKAAVVPASLRKRAAQFGTLAAASAAVTAPMKRFDLLGGRVQVLLKPGRDEVLLPFMTRVLKRSLPIYGAAIAPIPKAPLRIHVYGKVEDLARVSGLTAEQIRASGTIALCKYNRLMITSPWDLLLGYGWADTVAHELVHWLVIRAAGAEVPVWLHEGLARSFEGSWRGADPLALTGDERAVLARARRKRRFIPFSAMSPTMAQLPTQEQTQLAFAEVHHAFAWMLHRATRGASGKPSAAALIKRFDAGDDEAAALQAWLGKPRKATLAAWRKDLKAGKGPSGPLPSGPHGRARPLRFKRVAGADPFKGMGAPARRWTELGDRLLAIERPRAAAIEYRKALGSGAKRTPMLMRRLTRALVGVGELKDAAKLARETLARHPDDPALLLTLARALHGLGKHREALDKATRSAWINPYDPELHELMARAHSALGDQPAAAEARRLATLVAPPG